MKQTYNPCFINDNDILSGFYFDNGGCAEHERGIVKLEAHFEVNRNIIGIEGHSITKIPNELFFTKYSSKKIPRAYLHMSIYNLINSTTDKKEIRKRIQNTYELKTQAYGEEEEWISAAFDDDSFAIYVAGKENVEQLELLYNAIKNKDVAIFMGIPEGLSKNPFARGGLALLIKSSLSKEYIEKMYELERYERHLNDCAKPILDLLKENNKKYYACSPEWINGEDSELRFFLNPGNQKEEYWGWVSKQDLLDWIDGKGIIPGHGLNFEKEYPEKYEALAKKHKETIGLY